MIDTNQNPQKVNHIEEITRRRCSLLSGHSWKAFFDLSMGVLDGSATAGILTGAVQVVRKREDIIKNVTVLPGLHT